MADKKPTWLIYAMIFVATIMSGLGIRHYFFKDKYGIKPAQNQHKTATRGVIECFRDESGIDKNYGVVWVDTVCPHDDPARHITKGQTAVLYLKPVKGGSELICLHGLTLSGEDVFVAWRGSVDSGALIHELGHVAVPGEPGNHHTDPKDPTKQIYNDPKWGAEMDRIEKVCKN